MASLLSLAPNPGLAPTLCLPSKGGSARCSRSLPVQTPHRPSVEGSLSCCCRAGWVLLLFLLRCLPELLLVLTHSSKLAGMLIANPATSREARMCVSCRSSPRPQAVPHHSWRGEEWGLTAGWGRRPPLTGGGGGPGGEAARACRGGCRFPFYVLTLWSPDPHPLLEGTHRCPHFQDSLWSCLCHRCVCRIYCWVLKTLGRGHWQAARSRKSFTDGNALKVQSFQILQ